MYPFEMAIPLKCEIAGIASPLLYNALPVSASNACSTAYRGEFAEAAKEVGIGWKSTTSGGKHGRKSPVKRER